MDQVVTLVSVYLTFVTRVTIYFFFYLYCKILDIKRKSN